LLWIQNAPIYQHSPDVDVIAFIDHYLTCDSTMLPNEIIQIQTHHHTKSCKKHKHSIYVFGFPFPPIDETCIL